MTSIRQQIDAHSPIVAETVQGDDTKCIISIEDLNELVMLAHEAVHANSPIDPFSPEAQRGARRIMEAIWAEPQPEDEPEAEKEAEKEFDGQEAQFRNVAMHYAVQVITAKIAASHGLDTDVPDTVGHAESILAFLKG